jgi:pimeloyl-ACP methyl ester carboxylesterase
MSAALPEAIVATAADLPRAVAAALEAADPAAGIRETTPAGRIPFSSIVWGDPGDRPLVLLHGVSASARIWWRVGPALAASGRHVVAPDMPGHGLTGHWLGHHRIRDTAVDVAAWIRRAGLDVPELQVVGHSWGGMTTAALPRAGIRPATLVLLDPPAVPYPVISSLASDPSERPYPDLETAVAALAAANPTWSPGDVRAKAEALLQLDASASRSVLLDNGAWDGGLAELAGPDAVGIPTWIVRGDPAAGGMVPDAAIPAFAALVGPDHILTLAGAPHAPQRTHAAATTLALLRALG